MNEPVAYFDGKLVPASAAAIPLGDAGFVLGTTVAEQLRTFRGRIFRLDEHLQRLRRSLSLLQIDPGVTMSRLAEIVGEVTEHNHRLVDPDDDLGVSVVVTPGPYVAYAGAAPRRPLVCVHTYTLPFFLWAEKYATGQRLHTTDVPQVPAECWPPALKCRSRMHYFLADRMAAALAPGSRAVLLDQHGHVTEASTANVLLVSKAEGLVSPPLGSVLRGISLATAVELAASLGIRFSERTVSVHDLAAADEVLLSSSPNCLVPVTFFNAKPIGGGQPGPVFRSLIAAWSSLVGLDIVAQAQRFATRDAPPASGLPLDNGTEES